MNNREYSFPAYVSPEGETYIDVKDAVEPCNVILSRSYSHCCLLGQPKQMFNPQLN